jgi:arginyl-tRNA synthetase
MDMKMRIAQMIADAAAADFAAANLTADQIAPFLEIPPEKKLGDYAFPCFKLAKVLRKGPPMIAQSLAAHIDSRDVARCECVGGYLNFFFNRENFARDTLGAVLASPGRWGASSVGEGKTVCLDYSSINIAKRFHIGHLSTTMIGHALKRIYAFNGYRTVGINHLGDWGTQFGKMVCAYKMWGSREEVERDGVQALVDLYVRFHKEAEENPALEDEGRAWFKKIEDGDEEALEIFNWFKAVTLKDTERVYKLLGVEFDSYAGESFYHGKTGAVVDALREKGLLEKSEGAEIVNLEAYNMPPYLVVKSDGTTLYATRDLAAAFYRKETYHFDKCLYVVAYQQDLHFRQLFKVIELMGCEWAKDMVHVAFGMVSYEGQSLSTRKGNIVYLEDVLDRAVEKALEIINEKSPNLENKEEVARQVGIGAVIYTDLQNNRIKDIDFSWDRALSFEGETAPYVQYTHARCCSLLRRAGEISAQADYAALCDDEAQALLLLLSRFPDTVREAMDKNEPSMITRHVTLIAQAYNKFYYEHRILDGQEGEVAARVALTRATQDVIRTGLYLIGIEAPERM